MSFTAVESRSPSISRPNEEPSSPLVFIIQTGKARSKESQTQIRKHVMKDIGKSRRKEKKGAKVRLKVPLEVPLLSPSKQRNGQVSNLTHRSWPNGRNGENRAGSDEVLPRSGSTATPRDLKSGVPSQKANLDPPSHPHLQNDVRDIAKVEADFDTSGFPIVIDRLWTGRMDPFIQYPVKLDHRTKELVDLAFDDRYLNITPYKDACFPVGMLDPAAFHQVLSNALLNMACHRSPHAPNFPETYDTIRHHAMALKLVNERISDITYAISDRFIGTSIGFACYHYWTGSQKGWQMHMRGVETILRIRGGIHTLDKAPLVRTLLAWSDVAGSNIDDSPPIFPLPSAILPDSNTLPPDLTLSPQATQLFVAFSNRFPHHPESITLLYSISRFLSHLESESFRTKKKIFTSAAFGTGYFFPLMHTAANLPRRNNGVSEKDDAMLQCVRLASILFLAEIRRTFGVNGIKSSVQPAKLRGFLEESRGAWGRLFLLRLWCLAMGGLESEGCLREWFARELREEGEGMGLGSWKEVESEVRQVLWFEDCHAPVFAELGLSGLSI